MDNQWEDLINDPQGFLDKDKSENAVVFSIDDENLGKEKPGSVTMYLYIKGTDFEISSIDKKKETCCGQEEVYWLPYNANAVSQISMNELEQSNCKVFLTTTFSGCRFTLTNEAVAHIPSGRKELIEENDALKKARDLAKQGDYSGLNKINALARDQDEKNAIGTQYTFRRTLTPTSLSELEYKQKEEYKASAEYGINPLENAVVLGVRSDEKKPFHFCGQITDQNGSFKKLVDFGEGRSLKHERSSEKSSEEEDTFKQPEKKQKVEKEINLAEEKGNNQTESPPENQQPGNVFSINND